MTKKIKFSRVRINHLRQQLPTRILSFFIDVTLMQFAVHALSIKSTMLNGLLYFMIFWIYCAWMESSFLHATLGKWFLNAKVVDASNNRISFANAALRFLLKTLSVLSVLCIMVMDVNKEHLTLHDWLCKTKVNVR